MNETTRNIKQPGQRILVIDDEAVVCLSCQRILAMDGHHVDSRHDPYEGLKAATSEHYDIIILDLVMPGLGGLDLLAKIREAGVSSEVVVVTGYSTVKTAVEAMRLGARDYVSKPFSPDELRMVIQKVIEHSALIRENMELREALQSQHGFEGMIGKSRPMERVFAMIRQVAPTEGTVLVTGESGTGKEMIARAIHRLSARKDHAFVACDCSALAPTLLESELFGHVKGSFSGAIAPKEGLFEAADGGTLFLDEAANISLEIQAKLLRVLESRTVKRVGDALERSVNIRLIAATNQDLTRMVQEKTFRPDLYYRLNVVPIDAPPLRERAGDIPILAMTFLERFRSNNRVIAETFTPEAMRQIESYSWPGNVRELRNIIERIAILSNSERIGVSDLPEEIRQSEPPLGPSSLPQNWEEFKTLKKQIRDTAIEELERRFLVDALERCQGNVTKAAESVGMLRPNFHSLMQKHGVKGKTEMSD